MPRPLTFYTQPQWKHPSHGARFMYAIYAQPLSLKVLGTNYYSRGQFTTCSCEILVVMQQLGTEGDGGRERGGRGKEGGRGKREGGREGKRERERDGGREGGKEGCESF